MSSRHRESNPQGFALPQQKTLTRHRTASTMDQRDIENEDQRRRRHSRQRPQQLNPHQERRRRDSMAAARERHSIHLESAPWLGQRNQQPQSRPQPQQQVQRDASRPCQPQPAPPFQYKKCQPDESQATKGSSSQFTQATSHSTACSNDSLMSDGTRTVLYGKAVKMNHAMVRRAHHMIKNIERSRALAEGSHRRRSMEIDGYRFVSLSQGVAIYEDATYIRLEHKTTRPRPRFVGVSAVKATLDEFIDAFGRDSELAFSHLNPDMTSCRQMHTISEEMDRRIGVKWMAMQPAWTGSLARRRDFVVLECEENFSLATTTGAVNTTSSKGSPHKERRGWVQMMHSVQLPWCPPMEKTSSIVRGSMYQTGTIVLESEASPEWLHVLSVVEIDMKGNIADRSQRANALRRIEGLEAVAPTLVKQRLQRMSLLRTKQFNAAKPAKDSHCSVCTQRFGLTSLRLHHYCRKCSASVCGRCSRNWQIDPAVKKKTRVCGLCIMAACPTKGSGSAVGDDEVAQGILSMQRAISVHMSQHEPREDKESLESAPQNPSRTSSMQLPVAPSSQPRISRYFDLPMDARELGRCSEDDESDSEDTIYAFSERGKPFVPAHGGLDDSNDSGHSVFQGRRSGASRISRSSRSTVAEEDEDEEDYEGRHSGRQTRAKSAAYRKMLPEDEIHLAKNLHHTTSGKFTYTRRRNSSMSSSPPLEFVVPFCTTAELARVSLLDREHARVCEGEWRQRVLARFGAPRFRTLAWRKCFQLRAHLARKVVDAVSARVYLMNGRGETHFFAIPGAKALMCSRERAVVYNRCERMFDLSLRINRSIQEISALIGMVSVDEARGLLNEHINLMASVASLRGSLLFESELFQAFPAPVLLDANALLRGTFTFPSADFVEGTSTLMMQVWASIDGLIYRPLAPPTVLEPSSVLLLPGETGAIRAEVNAELEDDADLAGENDEIGGDNQVPEVIPTTRATPVKDYNAVKLHDLSGMTIHIDDNTLRYRLDAREMCVNALVSNTYLLYLFNPLNFRPLDWTFNAVVHVNNVAYELPVQREGVFLNTSSHALRVFLSYGKIPEGENDDDGASSSSSNRPRGGEDSEPLDIPYETTAPGDNSSQVLICFRLTATNRISKEIREIASKTSSLSAKNFDDETCETGGVRVAPVSSAVGAEATDSENEDVGKPTDAASLESTERHVHLPFDAMICYSFSPCSLQYVEFAIGFEPLMHQLGVSTFLPEPPALPVSA